MPAVVTAIQEELLQLRQVVEALSDEKGEEERVAALRLAAGLRRFYIGCERILNLIMRATQTVAGHGLDWHQRLLAEAALPQRDLRPPIISPATRQELSQLFAFLQLFRNICGYLPSPARLHELRQTTLALFPRFTHEIEQFSDWLGSTVGVPAVTAAGRQAEGEP